MPPRPRFIPAIGPARLTARDKVLAAWRGVDVSAQERALKERARSAGAVMEKVLTGIRWDRRRGEAEVVKVWNELLDPTITAHAQPTGIRKGTVFVTVDSNVWLSEILVYRRKEILERLQHSFGSDLVSRLSFRVG